MLADNAAIFRAAAISPVATATNHSVRRLLSTLPDPGRRLLAEVAKAPFNVTATLPSASTMLVSWKVDSLTSAPTPQGTCFDKYQSPTGGPCAGWASTCLTNALYMAEWCASTCNVCQVFFCRISLMFV